LTGVDGPWLRQKLGIVVLIKTGPVVELLSWQQHNRCCFVSFVINISGAKPEKHRFNTSRDTAHSAFCNFSCTTYDTITFLCITEKHQHLQNEKRYSKMENVIIIFFEKRNKLQLFFIS